MENQDTKYYRKLAEELVLSGFGSAYMDEHTMKAMLVVLNTFLAGPYVDDYEQFARKLRDHMKNHPWDLV